MSSSAVADTSDDGTSIGRHAVPSSEATTHAVALIRDRLSAGASAASIAVLSRVNSALLPIQVALSEAGIGHSAPLDASVLGRTGVRTALAYLRIGLDNDRIRREDLFDTINRPARKVKSAVTPLLRQRGNRWSMRQLEQVADALDGTHRERFVGFLGDLRHLEHTITDGAETARCLWVIRNRIGLGEAMDALDSSRTRPEGSSHGDDLDALEQLASLQPDPAGFREWLTDRLRAPGVPDGVTLSTVHRVKGMEWDHVVVVGANQGSFPHRLSDDVEEERRVFHVAITRCRERVDVVSDRERVSPFLSELGRTAERRAPDSQRAEGAIPAAVAPTRVDGGSVVAEPGVEVSLAGGFTGRIFEVTDQDAIVILHGTGADGLAVATGPGGVETFRVVFGSPVTVEGRTTTLVPPPVGPRGQRMGGSGSAGGRRAGGATQLVDGGDTVDDDDALYQSLRSWRSRVAAEHGVPAYLVFHDRHLQTIAARRPRDLRALGRCPGVGPTKLERYGDDVLDLVEAHLGD